MAKATSDKTAAQAAQAGALANSSEKEKALATAMSQIDRKYGKGSIMKMGEGSNKLTIDVIPTGSIALDIALGAGGVPRGRVVEIYGPESSGKTTLAQHIVAEARETAVHAHVDALDRRAHQRHRDDADDHPERREDGTQGVGPNLPEGDPERLDKLLE